MTRSLALFPIVSLMSCSHDPPPPPHAPATHAPPTHAQHGAHERGMPHRFDDVARWSAVFDDPERDAWQKPDEVIAALKLAPDDVVADLGAGTGYFTVRLAKVVPQGRVLGIDVEPTMVEHLTERARREGLTNVQGIVCPPDDAALPDGVDLVLVVDTYHHIDNRAAYFEKVSRKLAPGGRLVIVDFLLDSERGPPKEHKLSAQQVEQELTQAGFVLARSHAFLPDQYILELVRAPG